MEEFLLGCFCFSDELNIVNKKNITVSVFLMESIGIMVSDVIDKLVCEKLTACVDNFCIGTLLLDFVHDSEKQMGFSETGMAVNEKRVIGNTGVICNIESSCMGKAV